MGDDGYRISEFMCAQCGNCCRGEGFVRITGAEAATIAAHLGLKDADFRAQFCRTPDVPAHAAAGDLYLIDQPGPEQACVMLQEDNRCAIHPVKPQQCRDFPLKWRTPDILDYCVGMRS